MHWLLRLLRRQSAPSPFEVAEYTMADVVAAKREEALLLGRASLTAYHNVAHGTPGYAVRQLEHEGLFKSRHEPGVIPSEDVWHFTLTPKGEEVRKALL